VRERNAPCTLALSHPSSSENEKAPCYQEALRSIGSSLPDKPGLRERSAFRIKRDYDVNAG